MGRAHILQAVADVPVVAVAMEVVEALDQFKVTAIRQGQTLTLTDPSTIVIKSVGVSNGGKSTASNITIGFANPFSASSIILAASSDDLPAGTTYYFDGVNNPATLSSCFGGSNYCSSVTTNIGTNFTVVVPSSLSVGQTYHITIHGIPSDGSAAASATILLTPDIINPSFKEI